MLDGLFDKSLHTLFLCRQDPAPVERPPVRRPPHAWSAARAPKASSLASMTQMLLRGEEGEASRRAGVVVLDDPPAPCSTSRRSRLCRRSSCRRPSAFHPGAGRHDRGAIQFVPLIRARRARHRHAAAADNDDVFGDYLLDLTVSEDVGVDGGGRINQNS